MTALSYDGIPLAYSVAGTGEPVVMLIHGWCCHQGVWRDQVGAFGTAFRVVTLDLAGHGRSRAGSGQRAWSMEGFARDVESIADALDAQTLVLVGHSMGGPVALECALRLGDRCRMVLGVDTFSDAAFYRRQPAADIARRLRFFEPDFGAALAVMIANITAPDAEPEIPARILRMMAAADVPIALAVLAALLDWDIESRWPLLHAPVHTINSAPLARRGASLVLPGLTVHTMEHVGHFPMLEDAAAFNALARTILQR